MKVFVSYARRNQSEVNSLAQRIRQLGHDTWLDNTLAGGQAWWDEILLEIRGCDAFVLAASEASLESEACSAERTYAAQLGKAVIPIAVEPLKPQLLPPDLARLQLVDYSSPGEDAALELAKTLSRVPPAPPLPEALPPSPSVPTSYLTDLSARISAQSLSREEQLSLVVSLEQALQRARSHRDREDYDAVLALVAKLEERVDLYAVTEKRVVSLRGTAAWDPPDVPKPPVEVVQASPRPVADPTRVDNPATAATPRATVSGAWWLLPIFLAWLGGLIAWAAIKDRDAGKARAMLITGIVLTVVYGFLAAASQQQGYSYY